MAVSALYTGSARCALACDPFTLDWSFLVNTTTSLEELERRYHVVSLADVADRLEGFKPIA